MPEECNNRGMNRRDFLIGATAVATFLIPNTSLPIINSNPSNPEPAKRAVYEKAKKVYDLVREVWYPEREDRIIAAGTRGILNLASTGPDYDGLGYYLFLERDDLGLTKLELTAVGGT